MPSPYSFLSIPIWLWDLIVHFDSIYCLTLIFATIVMSGLAYRHVPRTFFATPRLNLAEGRAGHVGRPSSPSRNASLKASQQTAPHAGQTYPFRKSQPYDAFLVMDFEATCIATSRFNYANEIIVRLHMHPVRLFVLLMNIRSFLLHYLNGKTKLRMGQLANCPL